MPTSGPIVRTGATPEFWENWDNVFGDKAKKTKAARSKATAKKSAAKRKSAAKSPARKKSTKK